VAFASIFLVRPLIVFAKFGAWLALSINLVLISTALTKSTCRVKVQRGNAFTTAAILLVLMGLTGALTVILKALCFAIFAAIVFVVLDQDLTFLALAFSSIVIEILLFVFTLDMAIFCAFTILPALAKWTAVASRVNMPIAVVFTSSQTTNAI
jgi:hypothetical protein